MNDSINKHKTLNAILMEMYLISDQTIQKSVYMSTDYIQNKK